MRRALGIAGGLLVATAIFFVSGELLARTFGIVDRLNGYSRLVFAPGPSDELPYRLRPGVETPWLGVDVRVNRYGLRGPAIDERPAPGVRRILFLGDSVVFGQGVEEDETVGAVVARELARRLGAPHEVLNAGVQGYETVAEAAWLARYGLPLAPTSVLLGLSLNDFGRAPRFHPLGILTRAVDPGATASVLDRSEFVMLLRWVWTWARGGLWHQLVAGAERRPSADTSGLDALVRREHLAFYADPEPEAWARLGRGLARLDALCADAGVSLVVAIFPESYQVGGPEGDRVPQRRLVELCAERGLRCLDLLPAFEAAAGSSPEGLFLDAQHPNAAGHAVAGAAIAQALAD